MTYTDYGKEPMYSILRLCDILGEFLCAWQAICYCEWPVYVDRTRATNHQELVKISREPGGPSSAVHPFTHTHTHTHTDTHMCMHMYENTCTQIFC